MIKLKNYLMKLVMRKLFNYFRFKNNPFVDNSSTRGLFDFYKNFEKFFN